MKRIAVFVLLAGLSAVGFRAFADIADNFMAGGIAITGNGSFSDDLGDPSNPANQYNHLTITLSPIISFYSFDFLAFTAAPSFSYASNYNDSGDHIPALTYGLSLGISWYLMFDPVHLITRTPDGYLFMDPQSWMYNPNYPLVFNLAFSAGLTLNQYLPGDYRNGTKTFDGSMQFNVRLTPTIGIYYFISERYALDLVLNPNVNIPIGIYDSTGSPTNAPPLNGLQLTLSTTVGITFFVPWIERSQF